MELRVSFRGKPLNVDGLDPAAPLSELKEHLEKLTMVPVANQKLILRGKALRSDTDTLEEAGIFPRSKAGVGTSSTVHTPPRLMLVGSTQSEVEVARSGPPGLGRNLAVRNDLNGMAIPKGYKRVSLNYQASPDDSPFSPYRFQKIETLPGLPEEETAQKILETLADDPGIRAVLEKHRWTVGALCELYPEGKVGISDKCVLGLNQNHGQKILLRLRTDDLRGFRKMLSIRKVLYHELAHNDISDHNNEFYMLMRQVENEAAELDWTKQSGRTVSGGGPLARAEGADGGGGYVLVKEAFEGGSGRLGGDSDALKHMFSAAELAGQAAVARLTPEEQEVEECCGHTSANKEAAEAAAAATRSGNATSQSARAPEEFEGLEAGHVSDATPDLPRPWSSSGEAKAGDVEEMTASPDDAAAQSFGDNAQEGDGCLRELSGDGNIVSDICEGGELAKPLAGTTAIEAVKREEVDNDMQGIDAATPADERGQLQKCPQMATTTGSGQERPTLVPADPARRHSEIPDEGSLTTVQLSSTSERMDVDGDDADDETGAALSSEVAVASGSAAPANPQKISRTTPPPPVQQPLTRPTAPTTAGIPQPLDELLAMGFPREDAVLALSATGGSIPDAAYRLLTAPAATNTSGSRGQTTVGAEMEVDGVSYPEGGGRGQKAEVVRVSRDVRLHRAAETIAGHRDVVAAIQCLKVLTGMFRNLMQHPGEEKFRRIRRSNGKFKASVATIPGGIDVLLAAGFEERGVDTLELGRQDPGLIWLAKSTLEACIERLAVKGVDV